MTRTAPITQDMLTLPRKLPDGPANLVGLTREAMRDVLVASGTPERSGVTQHGGGESWTAFVAGLPSMLIEVDTWEATPKLDAAHVAGLEATGAALG